MNSMFAFQSEIHSVRHALSILGEREVRRWARLVAAVGAGQDKTSDLLLSALVRARFGELLHRTCRMESRICFCSGCSR